MLLFLIPVQKFLPSYLTYIRGPALRRVCVWNPPAPPSHLLTPFLLLFRRRRRFPVLRRISRFLLLVLPQQRIDDRVASLLIAQTIRPR